MKELTLNDFEAEINSSSAPVIVDFWAPWCGPCRALAPILEQIAEEMGNNIAIFKVNTDNEPELSKRFGVMSIPTLVFFRDGKQVNKSVGFMSADELKTIISSI